MMTSPAIADTVYSLSNRDLPYGRSLLVFGVWQIEWSASLPGVVLTKQLVRKIIT